VFGSVINPYAITFSRNSNRKTHVIKISNSIRKLLKYVSKINFIVLKHMTKKITKENTL